MGGWGAGRRLLLTAPPPERRPNRQRRTPCLPAGRRWRTAVQVVQILSIILGTTGFMILGGECLRNIYLLFCGGEQALCVWRGAPGM